MTQQAAAEAPFADALVLAADRGASDPVALDAGTRCKALAPIAGVAMLERVLGALETSRDVGRIHLAGPPRAIVDAEPALAEMLGADERYWHDSRSSPSASAAAALDEIERERPVLLTTADHALLDGAMVDEFLESARARGLDFAVALVRHETIMARFPEMRRTATRFADGAVCGCNLFAFMTPAGRELAGFWQRVENSRKKPWRVIAGTLGMRGALRYLAGRLTLEEALNRLSSRLGVRIGAVMLERPEAAVDVDSAEDRRAVEALLAAAAEH
ncbi:GTP:adenosylcobinamide-phosphate guanylyltransferase [Kushneria sinocarnis]|uniref:GTP:adenosylcobinamide-phosphate guanylyltransferase n=1 Tax=Kushneria sinocarnis TaxID=595502 RepID=A0A420X078_9GAMM|nr:NTP transferase domain-containing protein [Kushneria sinocarnis]RKR06944.1 GTP:adenosylcobinamide-phosphate guanylyltransferase [Kushneria sinocarnis]